MRRGSLRQFCVQAATGMLALMLLTGCATPVATVPEPTVGAAWGPELVPYDLTLQPKLLRKDGRSPDIDRFFTMSPGENASFRATLASDADDRQDLHVFLGTVRGVDKVQTQPLSLTVNGEDVLLDVEALSAKGLAVGDLPSGGTVTLDFTVEFASDIACDHPAYVVTWGGYDRSGARNYVTWRFKVSAPECPTE